jgi:hypothetical protein
MGHYTFLTIIYDFTDHFGSYVGRHLEFDAWWQNNNAVFYFVMVNTICNDIFYNYVTLFV